MNLTLCEGCYNLREDNWDDEDYISFINFDHWSQCNSNCIYCGVQKNKPKTKNNTLKAIKELIKSGKFKNNGEITFQGGEPTILKEFEDLVKIFINTKETYKKVKRVDKSNKVWDNIKHYRKGLNEDYASLVKVKYIIIPGINDNLEEINLFMETLKKLDIRSVIVDIEYTYANVNANRISPHIYMLMDYIENYAKQNKMSYDLYDSALYVDRNRKFEKTTDFDFENLNITIEKYKQENIQYNIKYKN